MKNKIVFCFIILYFIVGITRITPGDDLSSGDSFSNKDYVENYPYNSNAIPLKKVKYSFLENVFFYMEDQIPQGFCIAEDYIFISLYNENQEKDGIVMVFDKMTGEYLLSLSLNARNHLGGVAFDGENIWICNSFDNTIERISLSFVKHMIFSQKGQMINIRNIVDVYSVNCVPSGIAYFEGSLWIVTHNIWMNSYMQQYQFISNRLVLQDRYLIPAKVQGVSFGNKGEVLFSISYGRKNSSFVKGYASLNDLATNLNNDAMCIEMPPCAEQLFYYEEKLYVIFESASKKYKEGTDGLGKSLCPLDKVLVIDQALP